MGAHHEPAQDSAGEEQPESSEWFDIELTEDDLLREEYAWGRVVALAGVGAVMLAMGHNHEEMPDLFHTEIAGTPMIGWFRHVFPAVTLTAASEFCSDGTNGDAPRPLRWLPGGQRVFNAFFRHAMKNEKLTAFAAGFLPSVVWEIHQFSEGGIFGVADLIAAAGAGALTLAVSTKKVPIDTPRNKPLLTVRNGVNID